MVIYGEYLFLENAFAGLIILTLTGRICGIRPSIGMLALGSVICGIYAFILFWEGIPWWLALSFKIIFSFIVVTLVFSISHWKALMKTLLVFYIVSFILGGTIIASLYFFNGKGVTFAGAFYIGKITYIRVFVGLISSWIIVYIFSTFLKERLRKGRDEAELCITISGRTIVLKGFIDTGNFLKEPISGRPVCIATGESVKGLIPRDEQLCIVPYNTVDNEGGIMTGVRLNKAKLMAKDGKTRTVDIVLAISNTDKPIVNSDGKYDVILHGGLAERGILKDEQ